VIATGEVWISRNELAPNDALQLQHLTDPLNTLSAQSIARSRHSTGRIVGVLHADQTLVAAVATDDEALLKWKQAALAIPHTSTNPGRELVELLLRNDSLVSVGTVGKVDPTVALSTFRQTGHDLAAPAIRHLLLTHLALCLRATAPDLVGSIGAINNLLFEVASSPLDQRFHLPSLDHISTPALPPSAAHDASSVKRWLMAPVTHGPFPMSRLLASVHRHRVDLTEAFPDLSGVQHRIGLWRWAVAFGANTDNGASLPAWATKPPAPLPDANTNQLQLISTRTNAVRVVGYFDAALGLGEAARLCVRSLELTGESVETVSYRHVVSEQVPWVERHRHGQTPADVELLCLSGADLPRWATVETPTIGSSPFRIGLWFWETTQLSKAMAAGFAHVDEVWTTSTFTHDAIRAAAPPHIDVKVMPFAVSLDTTLENAGKTGSRRARERVASFCDSLSTFVGRQWCGFSFDLASRIERKNPMGLIDAWTKAFPIPGEQCLIIKTMNGATNETALELIRSAAQGRDDVIVIDEMWTAIQHHHFIRALSAYASLHRSEGYGLVLLAAMAQGVPVIATGASGNLAFMDDSNSWLVPAVPVTLHHSDGVYGAGDAMFEPNLVFASEMLRNLFSDNPALNEQQVTRINAALASTGNLVDGSAAAQWMARRLFEIRAVRNQAAGNQNWHLTVASE
jgi:Glycosyl transferases group 1